MLSLSTKKEKPVIILDIGSSSIGGAIVLIVKDNPPVVLYSIRKQIEIKNDINFSRFLSLMAGTLESVLVELAETSKSSPKKIFCILSSPWYTARTHFMKIEKKTPFIITHKMIDDLIDKKVSIINDDVINKKNKIIGGVPRIIDVQNIQTKLNGYETSNPYDKKVKLAEITLFVSIGSEQTIKLIEDKASRVFRCDVKFSSFSLVSFVAIRDIFSENNFLFLDITGEVTDVSMTKNGVLVKNVAFPLGKNFLIRRIASKFNTGVEEAESLFSMFNSGNSDVATRDRLNKVLEEAKKEWILSFTEVLQAFSGDSYIPNSVFITADNDVQEWYMNAINEEEFGQFTLTNDKFEIKILNEKLMSKFCSLKNGNNLKDPFIILETIFAGRVM